MGERTPREQRAEADQRPAEEPARTDQRPPEEQPEAAAAEPGMPGNPIKLPTRR